MSIVAPDPRPLKRIRDPQIFKQLHLEWRECVLCRSTGTRSLHHIFKHPRDDVRANLAMLCGSGTTGCHGLMEAHDPGTVNAFGEYVMRARGDTIAYLYERFGAREAQDRLQRLLRVA